MYQHLQAECHHCLPGLDCALGLSFDASLELPPSQVMWHPRTSLFLKAAHNVNKHDQELYKNVSRSCLKKQTMKSQEKNPVVFNASC